MYYRLGLDLGVSSIGAAIIKLDEQNEANDILDAGVRIFPLSEGAQERREKRTARKNTKRTKKRLKVLADKLHEVGLWNYDPKGNIVKGTQKLRKQCVYELRQKALEHALEKPEQIGRILMHLGKHRGAGFISAKKEIEQDTKKGSHDPYQVLPKKLIELNLRTIGEYFYQRMQKSEIIRQRTDEDKDKCKVEYAIPRYLVQDEFEQIWQSQQQYFPQMQDATLKQEIYEILFYECPPMAYAIGKCIFIAEEDRLSKAHPLAEKRRLYEAVHNIRLEYKTDKRKLTIEQIDTIICNVLMKGKKGNKTNIQKALGLGKDITVVLADPKNGIEPYIYSKEEFQSIPAFQSLTEEQLEQLVEFISNPVNPQDRQHRLYTEEQVLQKLQEQLNISDIVQTGKIINLFPKNRTNLGFSATQAVIDGFIKAEHATSQREITDALAQTDSRYIAPEEQARTLQSTLDQLPYYGEILKTETQPVAEWMVERNKTLNPEEIKYGKIANPAVHMMLNQLRLVINDIIYIYGKPCQINIEVGRDVGISEKKKKEQEKQNKDNRNRNEKAKKYLQKHYLRTTKNNILKYKLAEEQSWKSAFNPTQNIPANFSGFEIEHLIPRTQGGTDTYFNLCLVSAQENKQKGNLYPYEYFQQHKKAEEIKGILKAARKLPSNKAWRFESDAKEAFGEEGDSDETNRYLTDTRYMAKLALRYVRPILAPSATTSQTEDYIDHSHRILAISGKRTAKLRRMWNLLGLEYELMYMNIPRYLPLPVSEETLKKLREGTINQVHWVNKQTNEVSLQEPAGENWGDQWKKKDQVCNPEWQDKPRIDHRHHALDAIVVGLMDRSFMQQMAQAYKKGEKLDQEQVLPLVKAINSINNAHQFREYIVGILEEVKVSHKADHNCAGQLHKETGRTVLGYIAKNKDNIKKFGRFSDNAEAGDPLTVYRRPVLEVLKTKADLSKSVDQFYKRPAEWHARIFKAKQTLAVVQQAILNQWQAAERALQQENAESQRPKNITEKDILERAFALAKQQAQQQTQQNGCVIWLPQKLDRFEQQETLIEIAKHGLSYQSGNNHRADVFVDKKGDSKIEVISTFDANDKNFVPKWKAEPTNRPLYSLHAGDLLEMDTPKEYESLVASPRCRVVVRKLDKSHNAIGFCLAHDARFNDALVKGGEFFRQHKARKIELSPFSKVKRKHKIFCQRPKKQASCGLQSPNLGFEDHTTGLLPI